MLGLPFLEPLGGFSRYMFLDRPIPKRRLRSSKGEAQGVSGGTSSWAGGGPSVAGATRLSAAVDPNGGFVQTIFR